MKIIELTKKEYIDFFNKSSYNHFLQTYGWGQTCKVRVQIPHYLGFVDNKNNIKAACLAMEKKTYFNKTYWYCPRGIMMDYNNNELMKEVYDVLKKYLKENNAIYFKMDPAIIRQYLNEDGSQKEGLCNDNIVNNLKKIGFKHKGFDKTKIFNQPRYTFRINTQRPMEEIDNTINKTFLKTIKRSYNYDLEVSNDYDNETFYALMKNIAKKNGFNGNPKVFFEEMHKHLSVDNNMHYITIKIYPDKLLKKSNEELNKLKSDLENGKVIQKHLADTQNLIQRYEKDIEEFQKYQNNPDGIISLILICPKTSDAMWTLFIGNDDLAEYTFAVNRAYYEAIKYAQEHNFKFLDLFGTMGDPASKERNNASLHEYKRKMGGDYIEFIGEFDLVVMPLWYKVFPPLLKRYRIMQNKLRQKRINHENKRNK